MTIPPEAAARTAKWAGIRASRTFMSTSTSSKGVDAGDALAVSPGDASVDPAPSKAGCGATTDHPFRIAGSHRGCRAAPTATEGYPNPTEQGRCAPILHVIIPAPPALAALQRNGLGE